MENDPETHQIAAEAFPISQRVAEAVALQMKTDPEVIVAYADQYLKRTTEVPQVLLTVAEYVQKESAKDMHYRKAVPLHVARFVTTVAWELENQQAIARGRRKLPH